MARGEELILDLDSSEEERPARVAKTKSVRTAPRGPRSKKPQPVVNEAEDDEGDEPAAGLKRERHDSAIAAEGPAKKRRRPGPAPEKAPLEILAVDFGMWGVGNSSGPPNGHPRSVKARKRWSKNEEQRTSKLPAVTAFPEDNEDHPKFTGRREEYTGFEIPNGMVLTAYSKLCMARTISPSPLDDRIFQGDIAKKLLRPSEPVKYKKAMVQILKYNLRIYREDVVKRLGRALQADDNFHYVFTYPAACSEAGRRTLRENVKRAGFEDRDGDKVTYISEAHAAASAALIDCRWTMNLEEFNKVFEKYKAVMVLDCGALTVDATTITMIGTDSKLRILETCVSNGGNCGTTAIISRLLKSFEDKFGEAFSSIPPTQLDRGSPFYKACENVLRNYDEPSENDDQDDDGFVEEKYKFPLKLPDGFRHDDYKSSTGEAYLYDSEIQRAFDDNFEYIKAIMRDQWQKTFLEGSKTNKPRNQAPEKIQMTDAIVTGGGSLYPYIEKLVEQFCQAHKVRCILMEDRDSAVCRGALINAMNEDFFGWRLSRAYFGILVHENGRTYIKWFIVRGQQINVKEGIVVNKCPGRLKLNTSAIDGILKGMRQQLPGLTIYTFHGHLEDGQNPPDQPTDAGVERAGRIVIDGSGFSQSFKSKLQKALRDGEEQSVKTIVSVTVDGSGRLFFAAKSGKIKLGQGELRYDATDADPHSW